MRKKEYGKIIAAALLATMLTGSMTFAEEAAVSEAASASEAASVSEVASVREVTTASEAEEVREAVEVSETEEASEKEESNETEEVSETDGEAETLTEAAALDYLGHKLEETSEHLMKTGEDVDDIYMELNWTSIADTFPSKFDLRDRGTVTAVENQAPWGTCWSFATCAASETSILNSLGMTTDEYRETYGEDLDLSEKHLAWFTAQALPELEDYPEGEYPYEPSQAGEGFHILEGLDAEPLDQGGNYFLSATSLSDGIGILKEKYAPYENSEGKAEKSGDWSLPEEMRYGVSYELKDANILPAPSAHDKEGNYIYRPEATEAIKAELLAGRAVAISIKADKSRPDMSKEEQRERFEKDLEDVTTVTEEEKAAYIDVRAGITDTADLSDDELRDLIMIRIRINDMPEDTYDLAGFDHDQLAQILMSADFGDTYEGIVAYDSKPPYMTFVGSDPVIYAQYCYEDVPTSHGVTVVGWDDSFPADSWPEDRRPPADGVWIAKNSWGTEWGNEGYFLLSYYDMSLHAIETFEYVTSDDSQKKEHLYILEYDNMPAEIISSTLFDSPVYAANVFEIEEDSVLEYVSAMTGDMDTTVSASIFLLDQDAEGPTDGVLLKTVSDTFKFAGYHRLSLDDNLLLPAGSRISVVILENIPVQEGSKYSLVTNGSLNEEGVKAFNELNEGNGHSIKRYAKGIVNAGESFVSFEPGVWTDWSDAIAYIGEIGSNVNVAYDNLPVKAYIYPWSEIEQIHDLSDRIPAIGGDAAVCPEDGYTLIYVAEE